MASLRVDRSLLRSDWRTDWRASTPRHHREHRRAFRELITSWPSEDMSCLLAEFEATLAVHCLSLEADRARAPSPSLVDDLHALSMSGVASDLTITWRDTEYRVHAALLRQRSPLVVAPLLQGASFDTLPLVESEGDMIDCLQYLYTGDVPSRRGWARRLGRALGVHHSIHEDMDTLYEGGEGETTLVIGKHAVQCHAFVLAARSPFLRALLQRENEGVVMIDAQVLPRVYAPSLLRALYTDSLSVEGTEVSSLSQVEAMLSGHSEHATLFVAQQLLHIAAFLKDLQDGRCTFKCSRGECWRLVRMCEDLIVGHCPLHLASRLLDWADDSNASTFLQRHFVNMIRDNFAKMSSPSLLSPLREDVLIRVLSSDNVQASELTILETVVKWGELTLVRRMEEREPNIVHGTSHSIKRSGVKRSPMVDEELKGIVRAVLPLVRTEFILPPYHHSLVDCIARGLVPLSQPEGSAYGLRPRTVDRHGKVDEHWIHVHSTETCVRAPRRLPRVCPPCVGGSVQAYLPYVEETRALRGDVPSGHSAMMAECSTSSSMSRCQTVPSWREVESLLTDDSSLKGEPQCGCSLHRRQARRHRYLARLRERGHRDSLLHVLEHPWKYFHHLPMPQEIEHECSTLSSQGTQHDSVAEDTQPLPDVTQDTIHVLHTP